MPRRGAFASGIADFCCPRCGAHGLWQFRDRVRRRSNSSTTFATCGACGQRAFLKQLPGHGRDAGEKAARTFDLAAGAYRRFPSHTAFGIATPWHRADSMLVFACVEGRSPMPELRHAPVGDAASLAGRLGQWLALFHGTSERRAGAEHDSLPRRVHELTMQWQQMSAMPPRAAQDGLRTLVAASADRTAGEHRVVLQHGDAKPDNFLFDGRTLIGIDVDGRLWNVPENDLGQLDVQLRIGCLSAWGGVQAMRTRRLCEALAEGYASRTPLDRALLQSYRWLYLLGFWESWRSKGPVGRWRWDLAFTRLAATLDPA